MKKTRDVKQMVLTALFMAIVLIMSAVQNLGNLNIGTVSITLVHIPVFVGSILLGWKAGLILGLSWGLGAMFNAMTSPLPTASIFLNPLVSVVPRVIIGVLVPLIHTFISKTLKDKKKLQHVDGITAGVSTFIHSMMVIPLIFYVGLGLGIDLGKSVIVLLFGVFATNGIIEIVLATILVPIILRALRTVKN